MIGKELRRLGPRSLFHPAPEVNAFTRIVAGPGHIKQTDVIGFGFMLTAKWHQHAILRSGAQGCHDRALLLVIHVGKRTSYTDHRRLRKILFEDALSAMPRSRMRHFVTKNSREEGLIVRNRKNAGVDDDFAARQTEGVDLIALHK